MTSPTVTLTGMQPHFIAPMVQDRLLDAASDLHGLAEEGLCAGYSDSAQESSQRLDAALARISELKGWLDLLEYGHAKGPVEVPLSVMSGGGR